MAGVLIDNAINRAVNGHAGQCGPVRLPVQKPFTAGELGGALPVEPVAERPDHAVVVFGFVGMKCR